MARKTFGRLKPRYSFILNPYKDARFTKCPKCNQLTRLRKFALLIHVEEFGLVTQGKKCRFCPFCELLIAHQNELEAELAFNLTKIAPQVFRKEYFVMGTVERKVWRKGMHDHLSFDELRQNTADFKKLLDIKPARWYPSDES